MSYNKYMKKMRWFKALGPASNARGQTREDITTPAIYHILLGRRSLGSDKFWSFEEFKDFERKSQVTDTRAAEQLA